MVRWLEKLFDWCCTYLCVMFGAVWMLSVGWVLPRNRAVLRSIAEQLGLRAPRDSSTQLVIPSVQMDQVMCDPIDVRLFSPNPQNGNVTTAELVALIGLARRVVRASVFEIGTFNGRTTINLAGNLSEDTTVYTLDLPKDAVSRTSLPLDDADIQFIVKDKVGDLFDRFSASGQIVQLLGDSGTFDFTPYYGAMDLVFVDGSHSYQYVLSDTRNALRMVRSGGIIVWHDYGAWHGVTRALNEITLAEPKLAGARHIAGTTLVFASVDDDAQPRPSLEATRESLGNPS